MCKSSLSLISAVLFLTCVSCSALARWDTDPRAPAVQVYTPDSDAKGPLICDLKLPWRHCWGVGETPPAGAGAPFPAHPEAYRLPAYDPSHKRNGS
jgi:hypothetical protein